jgi:uncharacterized membrane protein YvbJ
MATCSACGAGNPDDATFCGSCARRLDAETSRAVAAAREAATAVQSTTVRWSMIVLAAIGGIAAILVGALLLFVLH